MGCPKIALQINHAFGTQLNKDVVRRILTQHYKPTSDNDSPSWLTFLAQMKDSLWSVDLFRCESISLKSYYVMVVMDQFSRQMIGLTVHKGAPDGIALCRMLNSIMAGHSPPERLSSDNDPLFQFHRWKANLRILDVEEVKTIPFCPTSHPFVERVIGTVRREYLNQTLFWNERDLMRKLDEFKTYYNEQRVHYALHGQTPREIPAKKANFNQYRWQSHCQGLFFTPISV
ncbi:MAG: integrase core domain-containing protein [Gammaproteobacteria bacterium]|nr:integrase core domain-containing protein [Gammaproteobacteria bacterium]